jgi:serine-type anaerobic sulfatase-maturating enzyme
VMALTTAEDAKRGPYQPCPCGSGLKFRFCHGNSSPQSEFSGVGPANSAASCSSKELLSGQGRQQQGIQ